MPSKRHEELVNYYIAKGYRRRHAWRAFLKTCEGVLSVFDHRDDEDMPNRLGFVPDAYRVCVEERKEGSWVVLDCIEVDVTHFSQETVNKYIYTWRLLDGCDYRADIRLTHVNMFGAETAIDLLDEYFKSLRRSR